MHQASAWYFIVNDVQSDIFSSDGAPCPTRDLFPWLNTRVKVHISLWTIREYPKRHFRYLLDSGIPSYHWWAYITITTLHVETFNQNNWSVKNKKSILIKDKVLFFGLFVSYLYRQVPALIQHGKIKIFPSTMILIRSRVRMDRTSVFQSEYRVGYGFWSHYGQKFCCVIITCFALYKTRLIRHK